MNVKNLRWITVLVSLLAMHSCRNVDEKLPATPIESKVEVLVHTTGLPAPVRSFSAFIDTVGGTAVAFSKTSDGAFSGSFLLTEGRHRLLPFAPSSAGMVCYDDERVKFTIPSEQNSGTDGPDPEAGVYVSQCGEIVVADNAPANVQLGFQNLAGKVKITLVDETRRKVFSSETIRSVEMSSETFPLNGPLMANVRTGKLIPKLDLQAGKVVAAPADPSFVGGKAETWLHVCPGEMKSGGLSLTLRTDNYEVTRSYAGKYSFQSNKETDFEFAFSDADCGLPSYFRGGEGTEASPYELASADDIKELAGYINGERRTDFIGKHYVLTNDIDMGGVSDFVSIGLSEEGCFIGNFDGKGFAIRNLHAVEQNPFPLAFFGMTGKGTSIKNLDFTDIDLKSGQYYCAAIVGYATGTEIENCRVDGAVYSEGNLSNYSYTAGIAGRTTDCKIKGCTFSGNVSGISNQVAGITGTALDVVIEDCRLAEGSQVYGNYYAGGMVAMGYGEKFAVKNCVCEGTVSAGNQGAGGMVAQLLQGTIDGCVTGSRAKIVSRGCDVGGIAGKILTNSGIGTVKAVINNCAVYCNVTGQYEVGGLVGLSAASKPGQTIVISNCAVVGSEIVATGVNSYKYGLAAGLTAWVNGSGSSRIVNCVAWPSLVSGVAVSNGAISGFIGYHSTPDGLVDNCYSPVTRGDVLYRNEPITYSTLSLLARCTVAAPFNRCYFDAGFPMTHASATQSLENRTDCKALASSQMKDGTLLSLLHAGISNIGEYGPADWVAGTGGYPVPEGIPADPHPQTTKAKRISLIGDSISTFYGWMPQGYTSHYPNTNNCNVTSVDKTYWYRLAYLYMKNAKIDMNISYSNTTVTQNQDQEHVGQYWYGHDFCTRFIECAGMGRPDIILVHGGTNDYGHNYGEELAPGIGMRSETMPGADVMNVFYSAADACATIAEAEALRYDMFCAAYVKLLKMMRLRYPSAKIVCIVGDSVSGGIAGSIKDVAAHYDARIVDLLAVNGFRDNEFMTKYDAGHVHPDANGMDYIAAKIYRELGNWLEQ